MVFSRSHKSSHAGSTRYQRERKSLYNSLTRRMVLFVLAMSLTPLFITGVITLVQFHSAYGAKVRDHLSELVKRNADNIDNFLTNRLGDVRLLVRGSHLGQLSDQAYLTRRLTLMREEYQGHFVDLGLVDQDGRQVSYSGPYNLLGADYSKAAWFPKALASEHFISGVFAGLRGSPHFIITVKKGVGDRTYLVKATVNFETFNAMVERIHTGETGLAFIFNREGEFQTKPRQLIDLEKPPYSDLLAGRLEVGRIPVIGTGITNLGGHIYAMAPLKGGKWILALQQGYNDAFAYMIQTTLLALAIVFISAGIIVVLAFYSARRLTWRIEQVDQERESINQKVVETGRLASIGELAAGIAHEINNPVAIMVEEAGWVEDILSEDHPVSEEDFAEIQRAVQQIKTQGGRCKEITYKLLSFARKTDPTPKPVQINELVEEVVSLVSQKSRFANVKIATRLDPELPLISASPSELQQVILNLLNNAVDAIDQGGGHVTLTTREGRRGVELIVEDTGAGIAEANLRHIFDPFFTTKPVGMGTGLGLSICYGIVKKLGGDIGVESQVGRGTAFTVSLPAGEDGDHQAGDDQGL